MRRAIWPIIFSLIFTAGCKQDFMAPTHSSVLAGNSPTDLRALVTTRLNFSSGTPKNYSVSGLIATTVTGGPGAKYTGIDPVITQELTSPQGVASDGQGMLYVVDYDRNQVVAMTVGGFQMKRFGTGAAFSRDGGFDIGALNHPAGIAFGPNGKLYVAEQGGHRVRVIDPVANTITTYAGAGVAGYLDGSRGNAKFNQPVAVAVDANNIVYVADYGNNMIRKIATDGTVSLVAGQLKAGEANGAGAAASFSGPGGIAVGPAGELYVSEINGNLIRKIVSGNVTTLAGGNSQPIDGTGSAAGFLCPRGVATDAAGNIYVTEQGNGTNVSTVRLITPAGVVKNIAGDASRTGYKGLPGYINSYDDQSRFAIPTGITVDLQGNIWVADRNNRAIRTLRYAPGPIVKTLAGNGQFGYAEGTGSNAIVQGPRMLCTGPDGSLYFADDGLKIRKVTPAGVTNFVAGSGVIGSQNGPAAQAQFGFDLNAVMTSDGVMFISDKTNNVIRKLENGVVSTFVGNSNQFPGVQKDGTGTNACIPLPGPITVDNNGDLLVVSQATLQVCRITRAGVLMAVNQLPTSQPIGNANDIMVDKAGHQWVLTYQVNVTGTTRSAMLYQFQGDGQLPLTTANFSTGLAPVHFTLDASGKFYFSDGGISAIYTWIAKPGETFHFVTAANTPAGFVDGPASTAKIGATGRIQLSSSGMIYFPDALENRIRMIPAITDWQ